MNMVRLAGWDVPVSVLRDQPGRFSGLFHRARAETGHAFCLCRPDAPQRLVIRRRRDRHHLASWPSQGHLHTPECPWYRPDPALSGRAAYSSAVAISDCGTELRLAESLVTKTRSTSKPKRATSPDGDRATSRHSSLGLLGLLHFLWEQAQLGLWHPGDGQRSWRTCHDRLAEQASTCEINGLDLTKTLHIVPPFRPDDAETNVAAWEAFLARLGRRSTRHRRGLVLGELRKLTATSNGIRVQLAQMRAPLFVSRQLGERIRRSYRSAFTVDAHQQQARRVVLCLVDRSRRGFAVIDDMAVMLTSAAWLPVESSHELRMADALVAAGRTVLKPMRYDHHAAVFPDFVLLDTVPETFIEVWGIQGREDYERRKKSKQDYYRSTGRNLLEWDVREPLPDVTTRQPQH